MRRLILTAACIAAMAGAAMAAARPTPPPPYKPPELFLSPSGEPFRATAKAPDPLETWFDQADTGHLGYLDRAEFRADALRFFKRLDTDGDGVIDGFEVADYEHKLVPELAAWTEGIPIRDTDDHDDGPHHSSGQGGHAGARGDHHGDAHRAAIAQLLGDPEPVMAADLNFDSHITLAEWTEVTDERFDALDKAKTGKLTLEELRDQLARKMPPDHSHHKHRPAQRQTPQAAL